MTSDNIPRNTFHDKGPSLADLVASSPVWESAIVPVGSAFRLALAVLTCLLAASTGAVMFGTNGVKPYGAKPGLFLAGWPWFLQLLHLLRTLLPAYVALTVLLSASAIVTEGFAVAGRRMQLTLAVVAAVAAIVLLPAAAAVLIPLANLVVYVVGAIALVVLIGWLFIAALDS